MSKWFFMSVLVLTIIIYYLSPGYSLLILFLAFVVWDLFYRYVTGKIKTGMDMVPYALVSLFLIVIFYYARQEISLFSYLFVLISLYVFLDSMYGSEEWKTITVVAIFLLSIVYAAPTQFEVVKNINDLDETTLTEKLTIGTLYIANYITNTTYSFLNKQLGLQLDNNLILDVDTQNKEESFNPRRYVLFERNKGIEFKIGEYSNEVIPGSEVVFSLIVHNDDAGEAKDVRYGIYKGESAYAINTRCSDEDSVNSESCFYNSNELIDKQYLYAYPSYSIPSCVYDSVKFYSFIKYMHLTITTKSFILDDGFSKSRLAEVTPGAVATAIWLEPEDYVYVGGDAKFNIVFKPFIVNEEEGEYQAYIPFIRVTVPYFLELKGGSCNIIKEEISKDGMKRIYYLAISNDGCLMKQYSTSIICSATIDEEDAKKVKASIINVIVDTPYIYYYSKPLNIKIEGSGYERCKEQQYENILSYFNNSKVAIDEYYVAKITGTLISPISSLIDELSNSCLNMFKGLPGEHLCYDVEFKSRPELLNFEEKEEVKDGENIKLSDVIQVQSNVSKKVIYKVINEIKTNKNEYRLQVHHIKRCNIDYVIARLS